MGLDMYLYAERYLWSFGKNPSKDKDIQKAIMDLLPELAGIQTRYQDESIVKGIRIEAAYWRKANQIHSWFVRECQEGVDECQHTHVGREKIQELLGICKKILGTPKKKRDAVARELLEPQSGFFFGSTDIDEWYYEDLERTVKMLESVLALPDEWDLIYHSSW